MRKARSVVAFFLVAALVLSAFAVMAADEPACVEGYRKANGAFFGKLETLRKHQQIAEGGKWVGIIGGATCVLTRKSLAGIVLCGAAGSLIAVPSTVYADMTGREMDEMKETYGMEDDYITYQSYFAYRTGLHGASDDVKAFMGAIGSDPSKTDEAMAALKELMESGALCEGGDSPKATLRNVAELIRQKLSI
jgi:hypothetical protein